MTTTATPTDRWLATVADMPALGGPEGTAERLLLLLHYGIDWHTGWVTARRATYFGKVVPHLQETAHILTTPRSTLSSFSTAQIETYMRHDDTDTHAFTDVTTHRVDVDPTGQPHLEQLPDTSTDASQLIQFHVETLPAGTQLSSWLRLDRATDLEVAFFTDVLATFTATGRLGGRAAIGHGHVRTTATRTQLAGTTPTPVDWRTHLTDHRDTALAALATLT